MTKRDMTSTEGLAQDFINQGDPTGWFEALYASAGWDAEAIPWEGGAPHPPFQEWVAKNHFRAGRSDERALVIACGLGNDAEALARLGFRVTAFDISPTAIAWCRRRVPDSPVDYQVADLFDPPAEWAGAFDFVLDVFTIQALPPELHQKTVEAIAGFVAPQGRLLACYLGRDAGVEPCGPPWPLAKYELDWFQQAGLTEVLFEDYEEMIDDL